MNMRRWAAATVAAVAAFSPTVVGPANAAAQPLRMSVMVDCEDLYAQPCITNDEGTWRMVLSYRPYTARRVQLCGTEKVVPPCLANRHAPFRYYWRGAF